MIRLRIKSLRCHNIGPIDLAVEESECITLSGPSGAGKTLMLRAIADIEPHEGQVQIDSAEATEMPPHQWRKKVGMLASESQWWHETVGEHFKMTNDFWLERLGFKKDVMGWSVNRLSGGERQRLALLRLLCNRPKALLLDEPTANLDLKNTHKVENFLDDYRMQEGASLLWVTHEPDQIRRVGARHFILENGRLLEQQNS